MFSHMTPLYLANECSFLLKAVVCKPLIGSEIYSITSLKLNERFGVVGLGTSSLGWCKRKLASVSWSVHYTR